MVAVKSGYHIYVTGTGNTLASITTDINDTTFIEKTGTSPDVYTVKGNVARYLRIRNGGTLVIGDSSDYSKNETLAFAADVANYCRFYVDAGGRLEQYGDTTIDFMTGPQRSYYWYIYGAIHIRGDDTYTPVWQNYQRIYLYEQQNNNTYVNDIWDIDGLIIGSACTINYYGLYFNAFGNVRFHKFKNIIFDKSYGRNLAMYAIRFPYHYDGLRNITFENITFENVGNYPLYSSGARPHLKNFTFNTNVSWKLLMYGCMVNPTMTKERDYTYNTEQPDGQHFMYLEGATFANYNGKGSLLAQFGARVLVKDTEWKTDALDSIQCAYGGTVMLWTGNTFTGGREYYDLDYNGVVLRVFGLDLTINDRDGNPIEDAIVYISQKDGKEKFTFHTDSNGKMRNDHNLTVALLTNQYQYGNSKTTNVAYWSDSSNSTYHRVSVGKTGYATYSEDVVMNADKSITVALQDKAVSKDSNTIMNSTDGEMFFNLDTTNEGKKINLVKL